MSQRRLARVTGEGLLIVVSIIAAFALQAWWESRQLDEELEALTLLLREDISSNIERMREVNARADSVVIAIDELQAIALLGQPAPPRNSLHRLAGWAWTAASFDPFVASYDVARGTPAWGLVPNEVKVSLAEYTRGFLPLDVRLQGDAIAGITAVAARYGGLPTLVDFDGAGADRSMGDGDVIGLLSDPEFISWAHFHRGLVANEQRWREDWIVRLEELLGQL